MTTAIPLTTLRLMDEAYICHVFKFPNGGVAGVSYCPFPADGTYQVGAFRGTLESEQTRMFGTIEEARAAWKKITDRFRKAGGKLHTTQHGSFSSPVIVG